MRIMFGLILGFTVTLALCITCPTSEAAEELCAQAHTKWSNYSSELRDALEQFRQIKDESMGPEITESLSQKTKTVPMARIVQSALKRRSDRLAEAGARCKELANREKFAFDDLRRCVSGRSPRKGNTFLAALSAISKEREVLLKQFQELMLDEAYVQYKGEREYPTDAYAGRGQYQEPRMTYQRQWGPDPRTYPRWSDNYRNPQLPYGYYYR
jgi:hypothetical protein